MTLYQFAALVIVDESLAPVAVITEGDVARAVHQRGNLTSLSSDTALHFGSQSPQTVGPDMEISDALHLMLNSGLTVLPVVEHGGLIGVALRTDLMQAILLDSPVKQT